MLLELNFYFVCFCQFASSIFFLFKYYSYHKLIKFHGLDCNSECGFSKRKQNKQEGPPRG